VVVKEQSPAGSSVRRYSAAGLFAGVGGIELGLHHAGHNTALLCEIEPGARAVLRSRFPDVPLAGDIRQLAELPEVDVLSAGFPCQDLSQAGQTAGIEGKNSGLVQQVFRLVERQPVKWLLLENVPFMLQLDGGLGMSYLVGELDRLNYSWAYRVVDARSFGVPQRRMRVILVASRSEDPRGVLFADDAGAPPEEDHRGRANGFYWTEGTRGLGWATDAIPTLKGGSTVGIPSPPAIWMPDGGIVTPEIRDAERLQGFPVDWTRPAVESGSARQGARWKLVGNAVSVPVFRWIGRRLGEPGTYGGLNERELGQGDRWPKAAWGSRGRAFEVQVSAWPEQHMYRHLDGFLAYPTSPLSLKATQGFLRRAEASRLHFREGFLDAIRTHVRAASRTLAA
jgi:DNA (cytosine-5)-methyltransferase 1